MAKISYSNLGIAMGQFLEEELAPKSDGLRKVLLYIAIPVLREQMPSMIEENKSVLSLLGALTDDEMVELDTLYPKVKEAFHKAGTVPIMGVLFDESDIDKIYNRAMTFAQ